jgi:O-antigen ligase
VFFEQIFAMIDSPAKPSVSLTAIISGRLVVLFAFAIGPVGVLAPKGIVVLVAAAGLAGLVHWWIERCPRLSVDLTLIVVLAALALWSAVSAAWALVPFQALFLVARLVAVAATGVGLLFAVQRLDGPSRHAGKKALLGGMILGLVVLAGGAVYAKVTGDSLWDNYYSDPLTTLNNSAVAISLLAWPAFAVLWRRDQRWIAGIAVVAVYAGFTFLSSGAALLAPVMGVAGFLIVWFLGRRGALALAALSAVLVLAAPQAVTSGFSVGKVGEITAELPPSAHHRIKMWAFAVEKIDEKPLWGWGMDASRSIPQENRLLAPNMEIMPLHPHNAFLQVRLELGIPGSVIVAALVGLFFVVAGRNHDRISAAVITGAGGAYLTVAALSYGVWQNWWVAFAWSLAAMTALAVEKREMD